MAHIAFFLLLHMRPAKAFKLFGNLVLGQRFIFKSIMFDPKYTPAVHSLSDRLLSRYYPKLHQFFARIGFCFGTNLWIENVYCLFLQNFPVDVCLRIWDSLLTYGVNFVFRFFLAIMDTLNERLSEISLSRLSDDLRRIYAQHGHAILRKSYDVGRFEYEFYFIDKAVATEKLA